MPAVKPKSRRPALNQPHREVVRMRVDVPGELHRSLKAAAATQGLTLMALVRWLLSEALEREAAQ